MKPLGATNKLVFFYTNDPIFEARSALLQGVSPILFVSTPPRDHTVDLCPRRYLHREISNFAGIEIPFLDKNHDKRIWVCSQKSLHHSIQWFKLSSFPHMFNGHVRHVQGRNSQKLPPFFKRSKFPPSTMGPGRLFSAARPRWSSHGFL